MHSTPVHLLYIHPVFFRLRVHKLNTLRILSKNQLFLENDMFFTFLFLKFIRVKSEVVLWTALFVLTTLVVNAPTLPFFLRVLGLNTVSPIKLATRKRAVMVLSNHTEICIRNLRSDEDEMLRGMPLTLPPIFPLPFPPFGEGMVIADIDVGLLHIFGISSLGVYGIITAGWSSNSKYGFLGSLRSAAQMVSYEVSIGLILITVLLCVGSLNLTEIVKGQEEFIEVWFLIPLFPLALLFFISALAETNRAPFDLPEAEAELVAGYNVEYSAMGLLFSSLGSIPIFWL
eukprot:jgi/Botrbrau1/13560/Bobra.4_2s0018.1